MKPRWYASILAALCLAGLLAMAGGGSAAAQEPGVDLGVYADNILLRQGLNYGLFVANYGTADAFGVRVEIEFGPDFYEYEARDPATLNVTAAPSGGSLTKDPDNPAVWIWEIPKLPAQSWHSVDLRRPKFGSATYDPFDDFVNVAVVAVATVSSDSVEAESKLENNRAEIWLTFERLEENLLTPGPFSVEATVDNHLPQPGEEIVFEISAFFGNYTEREREIIVDILSDAVVQVQLTPGLTYSEGSSSTLKLNTQGNPTPQRDKSAYLHNHDDNTGRWDIGPFAKGSFHLELTATVDADAGANEQCLTAEISGRPDEPLGANGGDRSMDNIARVCVQPRQPDAPAPTVLSEGDVPLWLPLSCVNSDGESPCAAGVDSLLVASEVDGNVVVSTQDNPSLLIAVDPLAGRVLDGHSVSVNDGNSPSWQTANSRTNNHGPAVKWSRKHLVRNQFNNVDEKWTSTILAQGGQLSDCQGGTDQERVDITASASGLNGGPAPGKVEIRYENDNRFVQVNPAGARLCEWGNKNSTHWSRFVEFENLGTYLVDFTVSADHSDGNHYSGTNRVIFHVGPMADLAVDSVWETAQGVTVAVANNGPDPSPGGQVMLNTGESCDFDHVHPHSEAATCTIAGAKLAGTAAIGTIEDNVKYGVCIDTRDGSNYVDHVHDGEEEETHEEDCNLSFTEWHSGDMYDPYPGNNVVRGPASSAPIPGGVNAQLASTTTSVTIRGHRVNWTPVEELYGWEVSHYEVERLGLTSNRWQPIAHVPAPPYDDRDEERGSSPRYRVRAVNVAGQEGPWGETGVSGTSGLPRLTLSLEPGATIHEPDPDDPGAVTEARVRATLNKASGQDIPITVWATPATGSNPAEETDYEVSENDKMMIPAGMLEAEGVVTIRALADDDGDNERVSVSAAAAHVLPVDSVVLTIQDDDVAGLTLGALTPAELSENSDGANEATYTVELDTAPSADVTVTLTTRDDITVQPDRLTFTMDNWDQPQTVTVTAKQDHDAVDDTATVTHVARGSVEYPSIRELLTLTIRDDDKPDIGVRLKPTTLDVIEGKTGKKYNVWLGTEPVGNVVIDVSSNNEDVTVSPASFTLHRNNWREHQGYTVTVSAGHDTDGDPDTAMIRHTINRDRTTADEYCNNLTCVQVGDVQVDVSDDDAPGVTVSTQTLSIGEGRSGGYDVRLNTAPAGDVTVSVSSSNSDVSTEPASLVFTAEDWNRGQRVTVHAGLDEDAADDTATLWHSVSSSDSAYNTGRSNVTVTVSVRDPDRPGVTVGPLSPSVVYEEGRLTEVVNPDTERTERRVRISEAHPSFYTVRLETAPTGNVVINLQSNHTNVEVPASLTFTSEILSRTVRVEAMNDDYKDGDKVTITHTVDAAASADEYDGVVIPSLDLTVDDNGDAGATLMVCDPAEMQKPENERRLPCGPLELTKGESKTYWVVLDSQPDGVVVISIESRDEVELSDQVLYFSGIQFANGRTYPDWDEPQAVTVRALADGAVTLVHKIADVNAHGWDLGLIGTEVGRLTVRVD